MDVLQPPKLATFRPDVAADAVALGNPPEDEQWKPAEAPERIQYTGWAVWEEDYRPREATTPKSSYDEGDSKELPHAGGTKFVVAADERTFDSGAAIVIEYKRNAERPECDENEALDIPLRGLAPDIVELIYPQLRWELGKQTRAHFKTNADGSREIYQQLIGPAPPQGLPFSDQIMLPLMALSSLQPTHRLRTQFAIHIVKTSSDPADIAVLKQLRDQLDRTEEIQFISRLPDVDFLLRPTHLVVDNEHRIRGLLFPHNPASSLDLTIQRFHPNAAPLNLSPYAATASHGPSLPSTPISISWSVKLSWLIDVAASATWLHAQSIFWNDLKTGNIVVCRDGHCRLIDYAPGGYTVEWSAPETATNPYRASAAKDVFALGLVMWVVAVEIAWFEREVEYVRPFLVWNEEVPGWFRNIVMSCLDEQPTRRPSARDVYEALIQYSQ